MSILGNPIMIGGGGGGTLPGGLNNCLRFSSASEFTLEVNNRSKSWSGTIYWTDGTADWEVWTGTAQLASRGGVLYLRGSGNRSITGGVVQRRWKLTGSGIRCDGNIETLLDYETVAAGSHPAMDSYCFGNLFYGNAALVRAPELGATSLTQYCYSEMFSATGLRTAPELPATSLAKYCYYLMFADCTSLTTAPALPVFSLAVGCYSGMFSGCTALTRAPALRAGYLVNNCYESMFINCTSLTTLPELPAGTLGNSACYRMFKGCTSLLLSDTQTASCPYPYPIPRDGNGTAGTDALTEMFSGIGGPFDGTPTINTVYYTAKSPTAS